MTGQCTDGLTESECVAATGSADNFQGFGTDCEPDCCVQPSFTGADDCADVVVQQLNLPTTGVCESG